MYQVGKLLNKSVSVDTLSNGGYMSNPSIDEKEQKKQYLRRGYMSNPSIEDEKEQKRQYLIVEAKARYTRKEMLERIEEYEEHCADADSHETLAEVVIDAMMNGFAWKGWNNASDNEIAEEFIRIKELFEELDDE
jgi:hypothetical protein